MGEIEKRQAHAAEKLKELRDYLSGTEGVSDACVYVIGSYGRGEASEHSDLDLFILGRSDKDREKGLLRRLDEILLKAKLIQGAQALGLPEFSGDGEYLTHYPIHQLIKNIGQPEDDSTNSLTARVLLLLESRSVLGEVVYDESIEGVLQAYWRNYDSHRDDFVPGYLVNDILRLWRTFCVNYEARTQEEPDEKQAKRKLKHYKLQHSRLLTCYSGLLYFLAEFRLRGTVSLEAVREMTRLSPLGRLDWIAERLPDASEDVARVKKSYEDFLANTSAPEDDLIRRIIQDGGKVTLPGSNPFLSETVFELINTIGNGNRLHRLMVV